MTTSRCGSAVEKSSTRLPCCSGAAIETAKTAGGTGAGGESPRPLEGARVARGSRSSVAAQAWSRGIGIWASICCMILRGAWGFLRTMRSRTVSEKKGRSEQMSWPRDNCHTVARAVIVQTVAV